MTENRYKQLIAARGSLKAKLTHFTNYLNSIISKSKTPITEIQLTELECRLKKLDSVTTQFDTIQTEIEALAHDSEDEYEQREQFDNRLYALLAEATALVNSARKRAARDEREEGWHDASGSDNDAHHGFVRLPKINLPHFDGNFQHWLEFKDTYISLIHNNKSINQINKFHYLRAALKGNAALVIQSVEFRSDNYNIAWDLLTSRFDNERLLINNHMNALFDLEHAQKESSAFLRNVIDVTKKNLCALSTLGLPTDNWDDIIIYFMTKSLDYKSFREWEEHRSTIKGRPTLEQFLTFLTNRADLLDTIQQETLHKNNKQNFQKSDSNKTKTSLASTSNDSSSVTCPMCKKNHELFSCQDFRNLDVIIRNQKMVNFKVCKNCLRSGHTEKYCKLTHCKYCTNKHNTLLHMDKETETSVPVALSSEIQTDRTCILLSTALVKVADSTGRLRTARVLLDNGSTSHFITQHFCEELGLIAYNAGSIVSGINNQYSYSAESCDITIQSFSGDYVAKLSCYVLPKITKSLPSSYIDIKDLPLPPGIILADPSFNVPSTIDILVGAEIFWDILTSNFIDLGSQRPKLQQTKLGWLVSGRINLSKQTHKNTEIQNCHIQTLKNTDIRKNQNFQKHNKHTEQHKCYNIQNEDLQLTRFWELESVSSKHNLSQEEQACEQSFAENTRRDDEGKFVVFLPLKDSPEVLGDSYMMAKQRFLSLERRLLRDPHLKEAYLHFMSEYQALGHMTENKQTTEPKVSYYLPHHGVIREASTTTKLRVVFDASAVTTTGKSLNDIQMVGPVVQDDLLSILLRFRQHKFVITGDIEKMYRAILVTPSQLSLQQILFRFSPSEPIKTYTLNTVTYGMASAPYLAIKCLVSLAEQCLDLDAKQAISRDFYVDDFLSGGETIPAVIDLCQNVIKTLKAANFNLRKWQSNNSEILKVISPNIETETNQKTLDLNESLPNKTLGLHWDSTADNLLFCIKIESNKKKVTKRIILSLISQVFDPLGLLGPCTVEAKMLMQTLWLEKCSWDDEVSLDTRTRFQNFIHSLSHLNSLRIPRWVCSETAVTFELHTFSDASERAYGACVYVRTIDMQGNACVRLLASKNKVTPLKPVTIPRLELCGALLGTRLCNKILKSLTIQFNNSYYWTDSMIVLGWLSTSPSRLKTFVRNRVGEIQDLTSDYKWSYVPSKDNPADLVSRGVKADLIAESALWWHGPSFLHQTHINFPKIPVAHTQASLPETSLHTVATDKSNDKSILKLISNKSNYNKIIRILAYIKRFIQNCKSPGNKRSGIISLTELQCAENTVLNITQCDMFPEEYHIIKSGQSLHKKYRLNSLSPFIDSNNILRVGGRLNNSNYEYNVKHPILLSSKHHLTQIIFHKQHIDLLHAGPQLLLSHIRQSYWPVGGRNLARRTVHNCVRCSRFKPKPVQPIMSNLPHDRTHLEFPFLHTGIDYAGPVLISDRKGRGSRLTKSYICVFVCFAVKALHLELVTDLTKEAFIAALHRFMSRRGKPQTISSDNATTFVGASNDIQSFFRTYSEDIQTDMASQGIDFKFIPPHTPHFGGLWESAVKSVKHHLRRILSLTHLTYEEMSTCLAQIEAILNSRPLTPLSTDPSDFTCLTPSHFLIGRTLTSVPHPPVAADLNRLQRHERIQKLKEHFWQRFSQEYVTLLQAKTRWHSAAGEDLKLGSLVLVRDRHLPPLMWLLGRIVKLHPGADSISRVADIRTSKGVIQRAYNNICPLPIIAASS